VPKPKRTNRRDILKSPESAQFWQRRWTQKREQRRDEEHNKTKIREIKAKRIKKIGFSVSLNVNVNKRVFEERKKERESERGKRDVNQREEREENPKANR